MKLLIFLLSLCVTSLEAATITNWGAQLPTMVPASGDVILMQKGGATYFFTPVQLATFISTNLSLGTTNAIPNLNGRGTNATFAATIGVATNLWQLLGTNGLPLVFVTSNQVMTVSNTLIVTARPQSTTTVPLTIAGSQGQDANLFNVKDYLGNVLFAISYDGTFADPRLASPSSPGALWTATDEIGNGAWSTNLTPQSVSIPNITAARALVVNASQQVTNAATSSADLDNFFAMGITSIVASTGIGIGTNAGTLVITNTGATTVSNAVIANLYGKGTNTTFYGIVTGATVRATNIYDKSNVKFWGAVGDWNGTTGTDDTAAIQAAVDFNGAGRVYLPKGNFLITTNINLSSGCQFISEEGGILSATNTFTMLLATNGVVDAVTIEGIRFNGGGLASAVEIGGYGSTLGCDLIYIKGCVGAALRRGITLRGAIYSSIESCVFSGTTNLIGPGLCLTNNTGVSVANSSFANFSTAVYVQGFSATFTDSHFWADTPAQTNLAYLVHLVDARDSSFVNCSFEDVTAHANTNLFIESSAAPLFSWYTTRNAFTKCRWMGVNPSLKSIVLGSAAGLAVAGTLFDDCNNRTESVVDVTFANSADTSIKNCKRSIGYAGPQTTPWITSGTDNGLSTFVGAVTIDTRTATTAFSVNSSRFAVTTTGVGIGESFPTAKLVVVNSNQNSTVVKLADASTFSGVGSFSDFQSLTFERLLSPTSYTSAIRSYSNPNFSSGSQLAFLTANLSGTLTESVRINHIGNVGIGTPSPLDKLHVVGGIVQSNGGIWQTWSLGASSAPATQGVVYWNDGTNICAVFRNAAGALSTNKLSMTAWP